MRQFSTQDVSGLTKASIRQLDYWAGTGLLKPSGQDARGSGSRRRYTFKDVVAAQTIQQLRERFCPLQKIRTAVHYLRRHYPEQTGMESLSRLTLLTDGRHVYMLSDERRVMEVVTKQLVWSVPLGLLILDANKRVNEMPVDWTEVVRVKGRTYHLAVQRDSDGGEYTVQCRELPAAIEQGRTATEAVSNGRDAIESVLEFLRRRSGGTEAARVATR